MGLSALVYSESVALNVQTIAFKLRNYGKFSRNLYLDKVQAAHYYFNRIFNSELFLECKLFSYGTLLFCVISYAYIRLTTHNYIEVAPTIS